eukprot:3378435-Prymnesium_polylepis.1
MSPGALRFGVRPEPPDQFSPVAQSPSNPPTRSDHPAYSSSRLSRRRSSGATATVCGATSTIFCR